MPIQKVSSLNQLFNAALSINFLSPNEPNFHKKTKKKKKTSVNYKMFKYIQNISIQSKKKLIDLNQRADYHSHLGVHFHCQKKYFQNHWIHFHSLLQYPVLR